MKYQDLLTKSALAITIAASMGVNSGTALAQQSSAIEEIFVTAQRREQSAQDASVSIDVVSSDRLREAGVSQATDLMRVAPTVQISMGGTAPQVYIRGAGDFSTTAYNEAAVAQNFDGVTAARGQWINGQFFDLSRVEVLKGPQGTLYGRNAVGGALNVMPAMPVLEENSGYLSVGAQNYSGLSLEGAVNIPLTASSAIRLSAQAVDREGYIDDGTSDDVHQSYRAQYLYDDGGAFNARIVGNYQHFGGRGVGSVAYSPNGTAFGGPIVPDDPWTSINDSLKDLNEFFDSLPPPVSPSYADTSLVNQDFDALGLHAEINYQADYGTWTVIPAYQYVENKSTSVPTLIFNTFESNFGHPNKSSTDSLEIRLANQTDSMDWVLGAFYWSEDQDSNNWVDIANVANQNLIAELTTEATALFGDVNFGLTENVRGILGVRYTDEEKTLDAQQYERVGASAACPLPGGTGPGNDCLTLDIEGVYKESRFDYRAGFEMDLANDNLLFATVATGFKSGGQGNADLPPYGPEELIAYTIGSKNRFLDGTLQFNAELFYIEYSDHQENLSVFDRRNVRVSTLVNVGEATSKGVSIDTIWAPTESDYLRLAVEYNKAVYDSFVFYEFRTSLPGTVGCPSIAAPAGSPTGANFQYDCSGEQMARAPEWTGSLTYRKTLFLDDGASVEFTPSMTFGSETMTRATLHPNQLAPSYEVYNFSTTYRPADDKYSLQLFVRNITEEPVFTGSELAPFVTGYVGMVVNAPRTYGARLTFEF